MEKKPNKDRSFTPGGNASPKELSKESEELFRLIFEEGPVGMAMADRHFNYIKANAVYCNILGYSEKELMAYAFTDMTHVDHIQDDIVNHQKVLRGELPQYYTEKRYLRKNGEIVWVAATISAVRDGQGAFLYFLAIVENINERKQAEDALRESEERYRSIFDNAPFGIFHATIKGRVVGVNAAFTRLLGYSTAEELIDTVNNNGVAESLYVDTELRQQFIAEVLSDGAWHTYENLYRRKDGRLITGSLRFRALPKNLISGAELEGFFEDISDKKKAEEEVQLYQKKLRVLSSQLAFVEEKERQRLANNIHDYIGQSLACALLKLGALENEVTLTPMARATLREVRDQIEQGVQYARSVTFELSPAILFKLGFEAVVEWLADNLQERYNILCIIESEGSFKISDNEIRVILFRAMRELLMNVVKHAKARNVRITMRKDNGRLAITIEDDGIGIAAARTSQRADGFGLFSVREQLAYIGGSMDISSKPGKGTTVKILSPLAEKCRQREK